jgi:hypothetical protein
MGIKGLTALLSEHAPKSITVYTNVLSCEVLITSYDYRNMT